MPPNPHHTTTHPSLTHAARRLNPAGCVRFMTSSYDPLVQIIG